MMLAGGQFSFLLPATGRVGLSRGLSFPIYRDWMKSLSAHALLVIGAWQDKQGETGTKAP